MTVFALALALLFGLTFRPAEARNAADFDTTLLALEAAGRARPTDTAEELERLLPETAEFSPQRLELLTVQGLMLAVGAPPEAAERVATRLDAWARLHPAPGVAAAALLVRARAMARSGNLQHADALMR